MRAALILLLLSLPLPANAGFASLCQKFFTTLGVEEKAKLAERIQKEVLKEIKEDYRDLPPVTPEEAKLWNDNLYLAMKNLPASGKLRGRKEGFTAAERQALYEKVANHPVANCKVTKAKYDPTGKIGFCFGRATVVHIEALRMGLGKENIRKFWAVGTMDYEGIKWGHHVAGAVRGDDGLWYLIDPEYEGVFEMQKWMKETTDINKDGTLRFFASDPKRFGPDWAEYSPVDLNSRDEFPNDNYNQYFNNYLRLSREEARAAAAAKRAKKLAEPPAQSADAPTDPVVPADPAP